MKKPKNDFIIDEAGTSTMYMQVHFCTIMCGC